MNSWFRKAMVRKVYNHLDRTSYIIKSWDLDKDNDFITYLSSKLGN